MKEITPLSSVYTGKSLHNCKHFIFYTYCLGPRETCFVSCGKSQRNDRWTKIPPNIFFKIIYNNFIYQPKFLEFWVWFWFCGTRVLQDVYVSPVFNLQLLQKQWQREKSQTMKLFIFQATTKESCSLNYLIQYSRMGQTYLWKPQIKFPISKHR